MTGPPSTTRSLAVVLLVLSVAPGPTSQTKTSEKAGAPAVRGLDHVPIAVTDLEHAAGEYRRLGFSLKPGQPHANGIRNQHVKFADGTELELITAPEARDALTEKYRRHLASGDGPAFLALFAPDARRQPSKPSPPLDYIFFGPRNASPTDRPEHFAHENTAESLVAVWVAADDVSRERQLFEALGATVGRREVSVPARVSVQVAVFGAGEVFLLPASHQRVPGRRIVGVTLRVRSIAAARAWLSERGVAVAGAPAGPSLYIPPAAAHGLWIELRQRAAP